ncbi:hypothetical protein D3C78_1838720 [compost metagenome]
MSPRQRWDYRQVFIPSALARSFRLHQSPVTLLANGAESQLRQHCRAPLVDEDLLVSSQEEHHTLRPKVR